MNVEYVSGDLHLPALCPTPLFLVLFLIQQLLQLVNGVDKEMELPLAQFQLQGWCGGGGYSWEKHMQTVDIVLTTHTNHW